MTGHVRERRPGHWELRVFVGRDPLTGKKRYATRTVDAAGRRQAEKALARLVAELDGGQRRRRAGRTFGDLLDAWYDNNETGWSPETCRFTRWAIDTKLAGLKHLDCRTLGVDELDRFYRELRRRGGVGGRPVAQSTVARIHTVVRSAFNQAVAWGWRDDNPAQHARPGKTEPAEIRPPKTDAVRRLVDAARDTDLELLTFVALDAETGARRGELSALRWTDLDGSKVTISRTLVVGHDTPENRHRYAGHVWPAEWHRGQTPTALIEKPTPKTMNSRRTLALSAGTVELLERLRLQCAQRALACGVQLEPGGFVFPSEVDGSRPLRPLTWSRRFARLRSAAGVDDTVRLHDLRHYVATTLLAAGMDLATVAGRLGHGGGGKTTLAIYGHFLEGGEPDRAAAELLAALTNQPIPAGEAAEVIPLRKAAGDAARRTSSVPPGG